MNNRIKYINNNKSPMKKIVICKTGNKTSLNTSLNNKRMLLYDYKKIYIDISIDKPMNITDIAHKYYDDEIYSPYFDNIDNYIEEIKKDNKMQYNSVTPFQNIQIPVLVNKENIYLQNISNLKEEITKFPLWTKHKIEDGDTISSLSYMGAKDSTEVFEIEKKIRDYNELTSDDLKVGNNIYIINPEIGNLRKEIFTLKDSLAKSLIVNDQKKEV